MTPARRSAPTGRIQEGIDLVTTGGTVIVEAGTYAESVAANKSVSLLGAPERRQPARRPHGQRTAGVGRPGHWRQRVQHRGLRRHHRRLLGDGRRRLCLRHRRDQAGAWHDDRRQLRPRLPGAIAVAISGSSDFEITGNEIFNNYAGVYLSTGASNGTVSGNLIRNHTGSTFTDDGSGVVLEGANPNNTITGNEITGNRHGIYIWTGFGSDLSGTTVFDNSITGNTAGVMNTKVVRAGRVGQLVGH